MFSINNRKTKKIGNSHIPPHSWTLQKKGSLSLIPGQDFSQPVLWSTGHQGQLITCYWWLATQKKIKTTLIVSLTYSTLKQTDRSTRVNNTEDHHKRQKLIMARLIMASQCQCQCQCQGGQVRAVLCLEHQQRQLKYLWIKSLPLIRSLCVLFSSHLCFLWASPRLSE